jgi:hypothetical protein
VQSVEIDRGGGDLHSSARAEQEERQCLAVLLRFAAPAGVFFCPC